MTRTYRWLPVITVVGLLAAALPVHAQNELREFSVQVDGKPAGKSTMNITRQADGSFAVTAQVEVKAKFFLVSYTYTYTGTEVWRDGKLVSLRSSSNDNGKRFEVTATADPKGLRVVANSREQMHKADSWSTSYWKLPDPKYHNQAIPVLDVDTGKDINGRLQYVGAEKIQVGQENTSCYRFRLTGGPTPVDLWFDAQHRLVRQEFIEDGHRTVVQLTSVPK